MRIVSFSITNFRSITTANKINISDLTVLVGKNNEGKSNLIKALFIAITALKSSHNPGLTNKFSRMKEDETKYVWERDFPLSLQNQSQKKDTYFRLEFELNESEKRILNKRLSIKCNSFLPVEIKIGRDNNPKITYKKRGSPSFNVKSEEISNVINDFISINYIPAIRTGDTAIGVISDLISEELRILENNKRYISALESIKNLQNEILSSISNRIMEPLLLFLPSINKIQIEMSEDRLRHALRHEINFFIDDGIYTNLNFKGDGIKSVAALALLNDRHSRKNNCIVAIEEPESHLHPDAIHQLNLIIQNISNNNQVIITTHSPIFIKRTAPFENIIINDGKAHPAKSYRDIRETLGVRISDNLKNSDYVLVVEGETDKQSLLKLLPQMSEPIKSAIESGRLVIQAIGGTGKLFYSLNRLRSELCIYYVILDNDSAGQQALKECKDNNLLNDDNYNILNCIGKKESEFEDIINESIYENIIENSYHVSFNHNKINKNQKWSDRLKAAFQYCGKMYSDEIENEIKVEITKLISDPLVDLNPHLSHSLHSSIQGIERMLTSNPKPNQIKSPNKPS